MSGIMGGGPGGVKIAGNPADGGTPGGSAGGDLGGSYPSPTVTRASGSFSLSGIISVAIAATTNDWAPTGLSDAAIIRIDVQGGTQVLNGLTGGAAGRIMILANVSATNILVINDQSGASAAANRFMVGNTLLMQPGTSQVFSYDATVQRWVILGLSPALVFQLSQNNTVSGSGTWAGGAGLTLNATAGGGFYRQSVTTPAVIAANQNNYTVTLAETLRLSANVGPFNITGLAGGSDGRDITIRNVGANTFVLTNEDAGSTAANRFTIGAATLTVLAGGSVMIRYDGATSRWVPIAAWRCT